MTAKEVSAITGVSVRTLHYYDQIKLLCPARNRDNDYRTYSHSDLDLLQQILFFKECGFSLSHIQKLVSDPQFNQMQAFNMQKKYLLHEKKRIDSMLDTLEKTIQSMKGKNTMTLEEKFSGFHFDENPYEEEARKLYGDKAIDKSSSHIKALAPEKKKDLETAMNQMFQNLASLKSLDPACEEVQQAMAKMYHQFNSSFGYHYTPQAFAGVGQMYIADERFTKNVDSFGEGLSQFLAASMSIYAKNNS